MSEPKSKNIVWHEHTVSKDERERISGHRGCTVWFTGLSGSGKSTLANLLEKALWERGVRAFVNAIAPGFLLTERAAVSAH